MYRSAWRFGMGAGLVLSLLAVHLAQAQQSTPTQVGLLGYWKFDEGQGDLAADSSGHRYDGEIVNGEWVKGPFGVALRFNGQDSYVSIPQVEGLDGANELTVEAWVFWEGTGQYPNILTGGRWSPGGFLIFVSNNSCSFRMGRPGAAGGRPSGEWRETSANFLSPFALGRWYHLAAVFRRPRLQTYVNGQAVGAADWDFPVGYSGDIVVGRWSENISHLGLIDEVKIYTRALKAEEIKASYEGQARARIVAAGVKPYEKIAVSEKVEPSAMTFQNELAKLTLSERMRVTGLVDIQSGKSYVARSTPLATLKRTGRIFRTTGGVFKDGKLTLEFAQAGASLVLGVRSEKHYFVFEILSVSPEDVDEVALLNLQVTPSKYVNQMVGQASDDEFAVCLRGLNLQANPAVGGAKPLLRAICLRKYGLVGAKAALVACPSPRLRDVLKKLVYAENTLPSPVGGPFALDADLARCSYLFSTNLSEKNVDEWIDLARTAGTPIIHMADWYQTMGHYEPRKSLFPHGVKGLKGVVQRIHEAGLWAGMHTLTGCISANDPYVTPIPDRRLAKDRTFTLAAAVDEKQNTLTVLENPSGLDTVLTYGSRGNLLQVDDEVIQYTGLVEQPPYAFTGCRRGAMGTKVQSHAAGAAVHHLWHRYGFLPDEHSTLVDEVADNIARVINECGFDLIYMDGAEGMPDGWYGASKMRMAIFSRVKRPLRVESSWGELHHCWPFHSVLGAWDYPQWGLKQFTDLHCKSNERFEKNCMMPAQLGWWVFLPPGPDHDAELPDEMEYLCAKSLGHNYSMSFEVVYLPSEARNARQDEFVRMIGRYEKLRLSGYFSDSVKEQLRTPGAEFHLTQAADGEWQFLPTDYIAHKAKVPGETVAWKVTNRFAAQPVSLRIQALYSAGPYDGSEGLILADFRDPKEFNQTGAAPGVTCSLTSSKDQIKVGLASGCLTVANSKAEPTAAWAYAAKTFDPPLDIRQFGALGLWIYGDGKGEILNFQLTNPRIHYGCRICDDHYVTVDFKGWRYIEIPLRERDAERYDDYTWPYRDTSGLYRTSLIRTCLSGFTIYANNIPRGEQVRCYISPVKLLPVVKRTLKNPSFTIGAKKVTFPVAMESGQYIEFHSASDCKLRDERGAVVADVASQGEAPTLAPGENSCTFACEPPPNQSCRAKIMVICYGPPVRGLAPGKESLKEKFRDLDHFSLTARHDGTLGLVRHDEKVIRRLDGKDNVWTLMNEDANEQNITELRLSVRHETPGKEYEEAMTLVDFEDPGVFKDDAAQAAFVVGPRKRGWVKEGVTATYSSGVGRAGVGRACGVFEATSGLGDSSGWAAFVKPFPTPLDLRFMQGLGLWVKGDARGAYLKIQLQDIYGQRMDYYIKLDFSDWRYCELTRPAMGDLDRSQVARLLFCLVSVPPKGTITCCVDDVRALKALPQRNVLNPKITIGQTWLRFPFTLTHGDALVLRKDGTCRIMKADGHIQQVNPPGAMPRLKPGLNEVRLDCDRDLANEVKLTLTRE